MWIHLSAALVATLSVAQQTDTTFQVGSDARLVVPGVQGTVDVQTWDRRAVRARIEHGSRDRVTIDRSGPTVTLRVESMHGLALANFDLTIPRDMAIEIRGIGAAATLTGVGGDVSVETVEGSITLRGGNGVIALRSVEGDIAVQGARGKVAVEGVDGLIQLREVTGDIRVHGVDGDIRLEGVRSANVDVATVDGDIVYDGPIEPGGRYFLSTHDGNLRLVSPGAVDARVSVATFDGEFTSTCPLRFEGPIQSKRFSFTLGSGRALVELESFDGLVELVQPAGSCR